MKQWNVPLPKGDPAEGKSHFAMAVKNIRGERVEFKGQIDAKVAAELVLKVVTAAGEPPGQASSSAEWQPIETAPGNEILLLAAEFDGPGDWRIKCGYRDDENGRGWKVWGSSWQPTRWMRMPAPPATTAPCSADSKP